jgi:hypothetical protein
LYGKVCLSLSVILWHSKVKKYADLMAKIENFAFLVEAKVFGPYTKSTDGRQIVIIVDEDGSRRTVSYPKYLMEQHLGRPLDPDKETVDHWDGNFDNNSLDNLRIVPRQEHSGDDTRRVKLLQLTCAHCGKVFERSPRLVRDKSKKGKVSSFCSRQCAGKYSRQVQLGNRERLPVPPPPPSEYYKRKNVEEVMPTVLEAVAQYVMFKYNL